MAERAVREAEALQEQLIKWRRELHQIPETGIHLPQTVKYVAEKLEKMEVQYEIYEDCSCIVAQIGKGNRCFMLRGDMDGLPMEEEAEVEFASKNGNMHACGHDLHATVLLGAAKLLKEHEEELQGVVKLLFQSGEETFQGAKEALKSGVLENPKVDAAFAMHVFAKTPPGVIAYGTEMMASVYGFKILLTGHGGHGSQPEVCIDPINAGVAVYEALQSLIARECPPSAEAALTIGQFTAGNAANIIPEKCVLQGTLRTFDKKVTELLIRRINEIVPNIAQAYRTSCVIEELSNVPNLSNNEELTNGAIETIKELFPDMGFYGGTHLMGSEDFAVFSELVPSAYLVLGAGLEDESKRLGQHNPKIVFNEKCLYQGAAIYAGVAMDWLDKNK